MKRHHLRNLGINELKDATTMDEWLAKGLQQLKRYEGRYVCPAVLAWGYQKKRLREEEFEFLYWRKADPPGMTERQSWWRGILVEQLQKDLEKYFRGEEILPKQGRNKKEQTSVAETKAKKKAAKEKFYAELRAKRTAYTQRNRGVA